MNQWNKPNQQLWNIFSSSVHVLLCWHVYKHLTVCNPFIQYWCRDQLIASNLTIKVYHEPLGHDADCLHTLDCLQTDQDWMMVVERDFKELKRGGLILVFICHYTAESKPLAFIHFLWRTGVWSSGSNVHCSLTNASPEAQSGPEQTTASH